MKTCKLDNLAGAGLAGGAIPGAFLVGEALEDCSPEACRILDRPREALLGKTLLDLSPPRQADGGISADALSGRLQAARAGLPQSFLWQLQRPSGELLDALITLEPLQVQGRTCLLGRLRDVTQLMGAENALRESETRLQQILDNATAVVYVKDAEGRFLFVNRQFLRIFGLEECDIIGRSDAEVFAPQVADAFRHNDLRVLEADAPSEFEETASLPDGEHVYISVKFPLHNAEGRAYAVCGISTDITERKRTEEALRMVALGVSGARGDDVFKAIVQHLADALRVDFVYVGTLQDGCGRVQTLAVYDRGQVTENLCYDLAGTPCEKVVGREFHYVPCDVQHEYPGDNMMQALGFESYAGYPLFDSRGRPLGIIAILDRKALANRELTESILKIFSVRAAAELERLKIEEASRASEASYRTIFEAAEDAVFVHDIDTGAIVDVNPKACSAYGYSREEMLRLSIGDLSSGVHPYTQEEGLKYVLKAKAGEPQRVEWHRRNKDGSLHWDEVYMKRVTLNGVDRILVFTREITERKLAEEELRQSEERYRSLFEMESDAIVLVDADTLQHLDVNRAACELYGYAREELLALTCTDLSAEPEQTQQAMRCGTGSARVPLRYHRKKDGTVFPVEINANFFELRGRRIMLAAIRDITERKQAEEERARLEAQLRQAQKMEAIGHLTGGIAHDFNNILTGVMGYIVLAQERVEQLGDAKLQRYLERAQRSGQRARDLIQQMLTFSRGQRGEPRPLQLGPLLKEAVRLLRSTLPSSTELATSFNAAVPPVMLDPVQVEQVLMNLCINARDAMRGAGRIEIGLRSARHAQAVCASCRQSVDGELVELTVRDTGPGIRPEIVDRIFEPFFSTKEVGKGSGMGLAMVHGIVHGHGGHILVDSRPGEGTAFQVLFRPLPAAAVDERDDAARSAGTAARRALRGRLLVVDDDDVAGEFMADLLESWALDVTLCKRGAEALEAFEADAGQFDLAVVDQTMPKMTGLELTARLRALRPDFPVVLYTGYPEGLTDEQVRAAGVRQVVRKPVDTEALFALLREMLPEAASG